MIRIVLVLVGFVSVVGMVRSQDDLLFEADFNDEAAWPTGRTAYLQYDLLETGYRLRNPQTNAGIGLAPSLDLLVDDFYTELTFTVNVCSSNESSLLFFARMAPASPSSSTTSYVFVLQCSGEYRARPVINGVPWDITAAGQVTPLSEGDSYVMGVRMQGRNVLWSIDGNVIEDFVIEDSVRPNGVLAPGAQIGFSYTINAWQVWALETTGSNITQTDVQIPGNPLQDRQIGEVLYLPSLDPPNPISLGLDQPVAAVISDDRLFLYNTQPEAVLPFEGVTGSSYFMEIEFWVRACSEQSSVGFVWYADLTYQNYYALEVQCDGTFEAYIVANDRDRRRLAAGRLVPGLHNSGQSKSLGVFVRAGDVWIYHDGDLIASFHDASHLAGQVGLILDSERDDARMDIVASEIVVFAVE